MLFFKQHLGPTKKNFFVCWCCSLYGVHVVLAHVLCVPVDIMETQENPQNQAETTEKNKKKTQNPGNQQKQQKTQENPGNQAGKKKNTAMRLRALSTTKRFLPPVLPPLPPPPRHAKS